MMWLIYSLFLEVVKQRSAFFICTARSDKPIIAHYYHRHDLVRSEPLSFFETLHTMTDSCSEIIY